MAAMMLAVCAGLTLLDSFAAPANGFVLDGNHRRTNDVAADAAANGMKMLGIVFFLWLYIVRAPMRNCLHSKSGNGAVCCISYPAGNDAIA